MTEVCYNFPQMLKANTNIVLKEDMTTFFHTISNTFYKLGGSIFLKRLLQWLIHSITLHHAKYCLLCKAHVNQVKVSIAIWDFINKLYCDNETAFFVKYTLCDDHTCPSVTYYEQLHSLLDFRIMWNMSHIGEGWIA